MAKDNKLRRMPRLRFPEFRDAAEWESLTLGDIASINSGTTPLRSNSEFYEGGTIPWVKTTDLNNSFIDTTTERITPQASALINPVGSILVAMYGGFNQIGRTGYLRIAAATNQALSVLRVDHHRVLPLYLLAWLNAKVDDWKRIASSSRKDPNITGADVARFPIQVPSTVEQNRIADCLMSLDACVAAQERKVEALKAHKRGLMQQLFPRKGETRPRLRFPEFRRGSGWVRRSMADLLERASKPVSVDSQVLYREIGIRSHGKGIFHKQPTTGEAIGNKRVFWVAPNAFVVNIVFAWEQAVAMTSPSEEGMIASHRFPMYLGKPGKCDVRFIKFGFLTPQGKHLLGLASPGGAGRNRTLGQAEFEKIEMVVPAQWEEQARIADCLVAIDAHIAVESEKLDALKTHKTGLMQQLFPYPEEEL